MGDAKFEKTAWLPPYLLVRWLHGDPKDEKHQLRLSLLQTCSRHAILLEGLATEDLGG